MNRRSVGLFLCVIAALGFSTTGLFAKLAYQGHVSVSTLLAGRFSIAALLLWGGIVHQRQSLPTSGLLLSGILLGLIGYGLQVTLLFVSLQRIDASLSALLFYIYPALVTVGALLNGREQANWQRIVALGIALLGVLLVFVNGLGVNSDNLGMLLSLAAAVVYGGLILLADRLGERIQPLTLSALVSTGAAVTFVLGGWAYGNLRLTFGMGGWIAIVGLAICATVIPLGAFYASLGYIGPSTTSILLMTEPVFTVLLATWLLGENISISQLIGGGLVLIAIVVLRLDKQS